MPLGPLSGDSDGIANRVQKSPATLGEVILPLPLWGKQGREPLVTPPMVTDTDASKGGPDWADPSEALVPGLSIWKFERLAMTQYLPV